MTAGTAVRDQGGQPVTAVVPVKRLACAKSRLGVPEDQRKALALAFALDTISSLSGSPLVGDVLVVVSDPVATRRLGRLGVRVAPDPGGGLGHAIHDGIRVAAAWRPGAGIAVAPADLPCLRADDVTVVVAEGSATSGAFVPDRSGTGTTLVIYPPGRPVVTRYGPGSAAGHRALGLHVLHDAPSRVRQDVDTFEDLDAAVSLGVGAATLAVVQTLGLVALDGCAT